MEAEATYLIRLGGHMNMIIIIKGTIDESMLFWLYVQCFKTFKIKIKIKKHSSPISQIYIYIWKFQLHQNYNEVHFNHFKF